MSLLLEDHDINNEITDLCGKVYLSIKNTFIFHCTLCGKNFSGFVKYRNHIKKQHCRNFKSEVELKTSKSKELNTASSLDTLATVRTVEPNLLGLADTLIETNTSNKDNVYYDHGSSHVLQEDEEDIESSKQQHNIEAVQTTGCDQKLISKEFVYGSRNDSTICPICKETLSKNTHLKTHLKRHTNEKNYICSICSKAFFTRSELDTHVRIHTGLRPYLCTNCGEAFTTASKLNAHVNQKHIRERNKQCPICKMLFYSSVLLKNHMIIHRNERPFVCEICEKKFKRRKGLQSHMKMHENRKEYMCDMCPARFNQRCNLNSHRKTKHAIIVCSADVKTAS